MKWLADSFQQIPKNMKSRRAHRYKAEKKRLQRMVNNYTKAQAGEFIAGATSLYTQTHMVD